MLAYWQRARWVEGLVLLFSIPILLFPEQSVFLTTAALLFLGLLWLAPLVAVRSPLIPATPFNTALLLFCATVAVAILVSADPHLTLPKTAGVILGLAIWRYLVITLQKRSLVTPAIIAFVMFGLGFILVGVLNANWLYKSTSQVPILGGLISQIAPEVQLTENYSGVHPNQIAGTIMLVLPLLLAILGGYPFANRARHKFALACVAMASFFCFIALVATQSRSGWVGLLGGILALLGMNSLVMSPSKKRSFMRTTLALLIILILLALASFGPERLQQLWLNPPQETVLGSLTTLDYRRDLWPWAIEAIGDFPFTGIGLGTFREAGRRFYPIPIAAQFDFAHAHNVFLQIALDLGIPGLIAYSAILIISFASAWQIATEKPPLRFYAIGFVAALAAFHIYGLADTLALGSKPAVLIWAIVGLLAAMIRLH